MLKNEMEKKLILKNNPNQIITIKTMRTKFNTKTKWHTFHFWLGQCNSSGEEREKKEDKKNVIEASLSSLNQHASPLSNDLAALHPMPPRNLTFDHLMKSQVLLEYDRLPPHGCASIACTSQVVPFIDVIPSYLFLYQFWSF